jgi:hypothetical protein
MVDALLVIADFARPPISKTGDKQAGDIRAL